MAATQSDVEKDVMAFHYVSGFGDLAKFIASDYDGDTAIFRRFDNLSSRNLLYLQSELAELECLQQQYDEEDARDSLQPDLAKHINLASRDWSSFNNGANDLNSPIKERLRKRMELVVAIREKLKEYRTLNSSIGWCRSRLLIRLLRRGSGARVHHSFDEKTVNASKQCFQPPILERATWQKNLSRS
jgi:hypothetical protein